MIDQPSLSPWRSVWLRPRDTISQIVATNPRQHVLTLAAVVGVILVMGLAIAVGLLTSSSDWTTIAIVMALGIPFGIVNLYILAFFLYLGCKLFRGRASLTEIRAVQAWGTVPAMCGLLPVLAGLILAKLFVPDGLSDHAKSLLFLIAAMVAFFLALWSLVTIILMTARVQGFSPVRAILAVAVGLILLPKVLTLPLRSFLLQSFNIPSGSMEPTLLVGDYFFVSKYSYGYSDASLPFGLHLLSGRVLASPPQRGDVTTFTWPKNPSVIYVKRVVGLPGDHIQMAQGFLFINDQPVGHDRIDDFVGVEDGRPLHAKRWRETLPNGVSYETLDLVENGLYDNTKVYTVPPGHYFVLGDNRDNSMDSRVSEIGFVPLENFVGPARSIYFSFDSAAGNVRWERMGTIVR